MRTALALFVGAVVWLGAVDAAAAPRVFVRGFRGPQAGEIKSSVSGAIRGAVEIVGSARGADAIVDGSVDKKGLSWVLSVTVRDGSGKAIGGRSYPMPAPRVDRATADKLRRDLPGLAARGGKAAGGAAARAEPEPKAPKAVKAPKAAAAKKVAKAKVDDDRPRKGGKRSAADEADDDDDQPRKGGKRSAADEADDERPRKGGKRAAADEAEPERPRKETAAQRRAREKREKAERAAEAKREKTARAAQAKREKAERAAQAKREKEDKAAGRGPAKGRDAEREEPAVRGTVKQAADDEATDVVGPRDKRADAKAAKARQEQEERDRKARQLAAANARLAEAQAVAKRQRDDDLRRKQEEAAARRAEEQRRKDDEAAARRAEERRTRQEREAARRARVAEEEERRAEARRAREAERKSREEEEERRAEARRSKSRRADADEADRRPRRTDDPDDDDRRRRRREDDARATEERETGRRVARRAEAEEEADSRRRARDGDEPPRRTSADDDVPRRAPEPREERTLQKTAERPRVPGRGPATLSAGVVLSTRHFELSPKGQRLPVYDASFFPAVSLEGELFPLALAGLKAGKDLGVFMRYDRVVGLTSQETDPDETSPTFGQTFNFNNQSQRIEGGLVYRLHTGSAGLAPVVRPMVAVGYQSFKVGDKSSMPETAYTYVALGLGFYVPIGHPHFGAISTVRYHIIVGLGEVGGFGSAWTAWGVDLSVGLRLFIIRSLELSASYLYERVEMTYQGLGPLSSERGITPPAAGSDVYQGGRIALTYHF